MADRTEINNYMYVGRDIW